MVFLWGDLIADNSDTYAFGNRKNMEVVGTVGAIITGVQLVFLIGSIFPTEIALRKNFDKNGKRKNGRSGNII